MKGESRVSPEFRLLVPLILGFVFASSTTFWLAAKLGNSLPKGGSHNNVVLAGLLAVFVIADLAHPHVSCSLVRRQTPRTLVGRIPEPLAGLLWGLDTGSVLSTYRASAASWAALSLTLAGIAPSWVGLLYACGFCLPLAIIVWASGVSWLDQPLETLGLNPRAAQRFVERLTAIGRLTRMVAALAMTALAASVIGLTNVL